MKNFLALLFLFNLSLVFSQERTEKISISYDNIRFEDILKSIEIKYGYSFYYVDEWLSEGLLSGDYIDIAIEDVLDTLFKNTLLNYYILPDKKIVVTQNSVIYNKLPEGFFDTERTLVLENEDYESDNVNPIFNTEEKSNKEIKVPTVRIGKENRNSNRKFFTISGVVKDTKSGKALPNVAIIVKGRNTGVSTNLNGYYEIDLRPGVNFIQTRNLGYKDTETRVIIYNNGRLNFDLNEEYEQLDVVVVNVNKDRNVKDANTGVVQIKVKDIKYIPLVLGERDILKVAITLPGISTAGEGSAGFNVRGGKADQNLILMDDAVIYNPAHFFGIFSAINPFTAGDVQIYKGNIPAEFGGRLS